MNMNCFQLFAWILIFATPVQLSATPREPIVGQVFPTKLDRLLVVSQLGKGAFGTVYRCRSMRLQKDVALKIENHISWDPVAEGRPLPRYMKIEHEQTMLEALDGTGYPKVYEAGSNGSVKFFVMEIAGEGSVGSFITEHSNGILPHHIACHIGAQMFRILQAVHRRNIIIYDIHPNNMMYQRTNDGLFHLRLIDPGMAYYFKRNGRHLEPAKTTLPQWDKIPLFTCPDDDNEILASRRCEIQRVLYVMLAMIQGRLPWMNETDLEKKREMKRDISLTDLCSNPAAQFLLPAFEHAFSLGYKEEPDYEFIIGIFNAQFEKDMMQLRSYGHANGRNRMQGHRR
jgi:serine/threonine protein kinase